jgi:hypothetical protein
MACVGLLSDDVSVVFCQGFVGSDTSSRDSVNLYITQFVRHYIGMICSELAGIFIGSL